jgi:hypothetical protein
LHAADISALQLTGSMNGALGGHRFFGKTKWRCKQFLAGKKGMQAIFCILLGNLLIFRSKKGGFKYATFLAHHTTKAAVSSFKLGVCNIWHTCKGGINFVARQKTWGNKFGKFPPPRVVHIIIAPPLTRMQNYLVIDFRLQYLIILMSLGPSKVNVSPVSCSRPNLGINCKIFNYFSKMTFL